MPTAFVFINTEPASMPELLKKIKAVEAVEEAEMVYGGSLILLQRDQLNCNIFWMFIIHVESLDATLISSFGLLLCFWKLGQNASYT
jgi:hypothetical protein